jgi:hypothetical protein
MIIIKNESFQEFKPLEYVNTVLRLQTTFPNAQEQNHLQKSFNPNMYHVPI